ncbi:PorT family protein [Hymenobacter oligotrophus]|uniref:PorT family protein n=1 Tax=Hymenobacter oligotrophus TaxID=2319843 RepID=A0A3B7RQ81_9BACT|nr:outer membrane beta-barrel protein [Hymenobacter oligotrophus]AYA36327.1 PorT family protein [Hymenobacter oligotrophus]
MKPALFLSALSGLLLAGSVAQASTVPAATPDDTIVVKLPNQVSMTIYARNKQQLRELRAYKLDSLMVLLDGYITQAERSGTKSANGQVTMEFYPAKDKPTSKAAPEQVRVTVRGQQPRTDRVEVTMGRVFGVTVEESTDGKGEDHVSVRLGSAGKNDSTDRAKRVAQQHKLSGTDFGIDVGLNALTNRADLPSNEEFDLRPWGSRYVALKWQFWARFGKNNPIYFHLGPEVAFNNFMFEGNRRPIAVDNRTTIVTDPLGRNFEKSKLAMTTLNLPVGITVRLRNNEGKEMFRIGGGGFVGYRLGSHTKIKYEEEGRTNKDKDRGSYNLQDFQYGVTGTLGVRNFNLFAKYNLNELFKDNRGPKAQVLSFGLTTAF